MDYIGAVIPPTKEQLKTTLVFPDGHTVGAYDRLAIEYGYTAVASEQSDVQHPDVKKIADKLGTQNLVFATDDDASFGTDPLAKRYDMTDDPIRFSKDSYKIGEQMRGSAGKFQAWYANDGQTAGTALLKSALRMQSRAAGLGIWYLGGRVIDHHFTEAEADLTLAVKPVHAAYQEEGLNMLISFIEDTSYWTEADIKTPRLMYVNPYGLGMDYGLDVAEMAEAHETSVMNLLSTVLDKDKLLRIQRANNMLLRGATTWSPPTWTAKTATKSMSSESVLRLISTAVWKNWKYSEWSKRSHWVVIHGWIQMLLVLHVDCAKSMKYFSIDVDLIGAVNEMKDKLVAVNPLTLDVATFVNATLERMSKVNEISDTSYK